MLGLSRLSLPLKTCFLEVFILFESVETGWAWVNPGFESGDLNGWTTSLGSGSGATCQPNAQASGPGPAPHTQGSLCVAPAVCLDKVHTGSFAAQLDSCRGDINHADWVRIEQSDRVPSDGQCCLSFWFAAVLSGHHYLNHETYGSDAYILAEVLVGGSVVANLRYSWYDNLNQLVDDGADPHGDPEPVSTNDPMAWRHLPWTHFTINLCAFAGQQATVRFTVYDCDAGGHNAFGYLDDVAWTSCPPTSLTLVKANNPSGTLSAGATLTYTLTYANSGASPIDGVVITDTVPAGTSLLPGSITSAPVVPNTNVSGNDIVWSVGYLSPGASGTLSFQVVVGVSCASIVNQARETDLLNPAGISSNIVTNQVDGCTPTKTLTPEATATRTPSNTPSPTPSRTPSPTFSPTATKTPTNSPTQSPTATPTRTPTASPSPTPTASPTATFTRTSTPTFTPSNTPTSTATRTPTSTPTRTATSTASPTFTLSPFRTFTPTLTATRTPSPTPSNTAANTPTSSPTRTPTSSPTATSTRTLSNTPPPPATNSPTRTPTATPSPTWTLTPRFTFTPTFSPTWTRTATDSPTATPSRTPTATFTSTFSATSTLSPTFTHTRTQTSTFTITFTPTQTFTSTHTSTSTATSTSTHSHTFTSTATHTRTSTWTFTATRTATPTPTNTATNSPTRTPTPTATNTPTVTPTPTPGLVLQKTSSRGSALPGDTLTYHLTLSVTGSKASGVTLTDTLPAELAFLSFQGPLLPGEGTSAQGQVLTWTFPELDPGSYSFSYDAQVRKDLVEDVLLDNRAQGSFTGGSSGPVTARVSVTGPYLTKLAVYNSAGELVRVIMTRTFFQPIEGLQYSADAITGSNGAVSIFFQGRLLASWDGTNSDGRPVSNGQYFLTADTVGPSGVVTALTQRISVERALSTVSVDVFNGAGEVIRHLFLEDEVMTGGVVGAVEWSSDVLEPNAPAGSQGPAGVTIRITLPSGERTIVWDGTTDQGTAATNGQYLLEVHWTEKGVEKTLTHRVGVLNGPQDGERVVARPSVLEQGRTRTVLSAPSSRALTLKARVYDVAGELVAGIEGTPGSNEVIWDAMGKASGLYLVRVELSGASWPTTYQTVKVLVRH